MSALQRIPHHPIASPVMQLIAESNRPPADLLRGEEDLTSAVDLGKVRFKSLDDRPDMEGMNTPHTEEAELGARPGCIAPNNDRIAQLKGHVMNRNEPVRERSGHDLGFGAYHQGMVELSR